MKCVTVIEKYDYVNWNNHGVMELTSISLKLFRMGHFKTLSIL